MNQTDSDEIIEQIENQEQQKQSNSLADSINPDPVDLVQLVTDLGKDALDFASSLVDHIDF